MAFSSRRLARWLIGLVLVASLAGGGLWLYRRGSRAPEVSYETVTVDRGPIVARLMASGSLSPLVTVQVGSQVSGRIRDLHVDFNSTVKKGQVIARIDPQLFEAAVEQARANHLVAQSNLVKGRVQAEEAARQLGRTRTLAQKRLVAPAELDTAQAGADSARAAVAAAEAQLAQARAALNQARVNLAYTTIRSPIDGVVISRNVDVGQTVAASLQAPTLFTIAEDLAKMQIHTNVAEADIGRVQPRMTVSFSVDAFPRERFEGVVQQIRNAPQTLQNVVTYDVVVDVENPSLRLRPGMTANVTFVYAETADTLRVANAALRFRPPAQLAGQGSEAPGVGAARAAVPPRRPPGSAKGPSAERRTVWVLHGNQPRPVPIKVGLSDGTRTAVEGGNLREGDRVITDVTGLPADSQGRPPGMPRAPGGGRPRGGGVVRHL